MIDLAAVVEALRSALPGDATEFALHEPEIGPAEHEHLRRCLESGWVSSAGGYVERFESALAETCGVRSALAVQSGTAALRLALELVPVEPGDEVLVPALTFVASANAVAHCGATPHFVDVDWKTRAVDPLALERHLERIAERSADHYRNRETGRRLRALLVVHLLGQPADVVELERVCARFGLELVHDAAQALGSRLAGEPLLAGASLAATSFNGNKIVTCGAGGALLSDDPERLGRARHRAGTARVADPFRSLHDGIGLNVCMPSLNAALGYAGLLRLEQTIARKRALGDRYAKRLAGLAGVSWLAESPFGRGNAWLHALLLEADCAGARDALIERLHAAGIRARALYDPLHTLPPYATAPRADLGVAEELSRRVICLPSHAALWVCDT